MPLTQAWFRHVAGVLSADTVVLHTGTTKPFLGSRQPARSATYMTAGGDDPTIQVLVMDYRCGAYRTRWTPNGTARLSVTGVARCAGTRGPEHARHISGK